MKRLILSVFILMAALPVFAQDEAAQVVTDAIAGLKDLESYSIHADQTVNMDMQMQLGEQTIPIINEFIVTNDIQVVNTADGYNLTATLVQENNSNSAGQENTYTLTFEIVAVDGNTYVRATDSSGTLSNILPENWVNVTDDPDENVMFQSFVGDNLDQITGVAFPIDVTTITAIEMLDSAEVDGEAVDVYQFQITPDAIIASHMFDSLLGADVAEGDANPIATMLENADLNFVAYVGQSDGILRQLGTQIVIADAVLPVQDMEMPITMQIEGTTTFGGFNEAVTIEVPEVE